jgi:polysaccharide deacetylase 2 family uncharacterized protein YibQ
MTKKDMMEQYYTLSPNNNYEEAQKRIKEAMENGEKYVYLPGKNGSSGFSWSAIAETIERLRKDGFDIDVVWNPYEYWSVEWGY